MTGSHVSAKSDMNRPKSKTPTSWTRLECCDYACGIHLDPSQGGLG